MNHIQIKGIAIVSASLLFAGGCRSTIGDAHGVIMPNADGDGAAACIELEYSSPAEVPGKLLNALGDALVAVTQPIHPYHCLRNDQDRVIKDEKGNPQKVWLPFWRVIGRHHGDSVVGIVYDKGWFGGWQEKPGDKLGKVAGLALLIWGADSLTDDSSGNESARSMGELEVVPCYESSSEDDNPDPDDWEWGSGRPVGGSDEEGPVIPPVTDPAPSQEIPPAIPPVVPPTVLSRTGGRGGQ